MRPTADPIPAPVPATAGAVKELAAAAAGKDKWGIAALLSRACSASLAPFEKVRAIDGEWDRLFGELSSARWLSEKVDEDRAVVRVALTRGGVEVQENWLMVSEEGRWKVLER